MEITIGSNGKFDIEILDKKSFKEAVCNMELEKNPLTKSVIRQKIVRAIEKRGIEALDIMDIISHDLLFELITHKYPDDMCIIELIGRFVYIMETINKLDTKINP